MRLSTFSCAWWPSVCLWKTVYSDSLPIFNWFICVFFFFVVVVVVLELHELKFFLAKGRSLKVVAGRGLWWTLTPPLGAEYGVSCVFPAEDLTSPLFSFLCLLLEGTAEEH